MPPKPSNRRLVCRDVDVSLPPLFQQSCRACGAIRACRHTPTHHRLAGLGPSCRPWHHIHAKQQTPFRLASLRTPYRTRNISEFVSRYFRTQHGLVAEASADIVGIVIEPANARWYTSGGRQHHTAACRWCSCSDGTITAAAAGQQRPSASRSAKGARGERQNKSACDT
jgi:hypothetical protein